MTIYAESIPRTHRRAAAHDDARRQRGGEGGLPWPDSRPAAVAQRKWQDLADGHPGARRSGAFDATATGGADARGHAPLPVITDAAPRHATRAVENRTGLPDPLKAGIEDLSGYAMDDVNVHYHSDRPARLQAHAYAQGTDIHLAAGQERHLPHEAWHVVQQKQGRVRSTFQFNDGLTLNDDAGLEREADSMGAKAAAWSGDADAERALTPAADMTGQPVQRSLIASTLIAGLVLWVGKKLYDANSEPEIAELQDILLKIQTDPNNHVLLTDLCTRFFTGKIRSLNLLHFRWNNVVANVLPVAEDYIVRGIDPDNLSDAQEKMLLLAEQSQDATPQIKARAMTLLAEAAPTWDEAPVDDPRMVRLGQLNPQDIVNAGKPQEGTITPGGDMYSLSRNGPIAIDTTRIRALRPRAKPLQGMRLNRVIGKGISGNVALVIHAEGPNEIIKKVKVGNENELHDILRETAIQMVLNRNDETSEQPTYARIRSAVIVNGVVYIRMEAAEDNWENRLKKQPPNLGQLLVSLEKLARGYQRMHASGFVHKDIKPDNVLVRGEDLLIADFGQSKHSTEQKERDDDYFSFGKMIFELTKAHAATLGLSEAERSTLASFEGMLGFSLQAVNEAVVPEDTTASRLIALGKRMFNKQVNFEQAGRLLNELIQELRGER